MFKRSEDLSAVVKNQGERLVKLEKENEDLTVKNYKLNKEKLDLIGDIDDMQEDILYILTKIENTLTCNSYGKPEVKIEKALETIRRYEGLIKKEELDNCDID